jgi:hypothetical protein
MKITIVGAAGGEVTGSAKTARAKRSQSSLGKNTASGPNYRR